MRPNAVELDRSDPLASVRSQFHLPPDAVYFDANSLGLLSHAAESALADVVEQWKSLAIEGWTQAVPDWFHLAESIAGQLERITKATPGSISLSGSTTVQLHQLLATLYDAEDTRACIVIDKLAFPTDRYAVVSFLQRIGRDPDRCLVEVSADSDGLLNEQKLIAAFGQDVQLAILPSVVFTTGQLVDMDRVRQAARSANLRLAWDCSHSAGVVAHDFDKLKPDAAFWCTYKYLNGGPGAPAATYLSPEQSNRPPGLAGWWGCDKYRQFEMADEFFPAEGAGRLQLGTPHILSLAPLRGSLEIIEEVGIDAIREKSLKLTAVLMEYAETQLERFGVSVVTPSEAERRGGHLTLRFQDARLLSQALRRRGFVPDFRGPDLIRLAPSPLYSRYQDCEDVIAEMERLLDSDELGDEEPASQLVH